MKESAPTLFIAKSVLCVKLAKPQNICHMVVQQGWDGKDG